MNKSKVKKVIGYLSTVLLLMLTGTPLLEALSRGSQAIVL